MAHGLINYNGFYTPDACYLWWFALRFYFLPHFSIVGRRLRLSQDS
jgi:hypothetical protein